MTDTEKSKSEYSHHDTYINGEGRRGVIYDHIEAAAAATTMKIGGIYEDKKEDCTIDCCSFIPIKNKDSITGGRTVATDFTMPSQMGQECMLPPMIKTSNSVDSGEGAVVSPSPKKWKRFFCCKTNDAVIEEPKEKCLVQKLQNAQQQEKDLGLETDNETEFPETE